MTAGFFTRTTLSIVQAPEYTTPRCGICQLYKTCQSPKMEPTGKGRKEILIIAEAPGKDEDIKGMQLVGNSGRQLMDVLAESGIDMRRDCWLDNSLRCRPPNNELKDQRWIDYCRPNITRTIAELKPKVIILLGGAAVTSVIGHIWKDDPGGISRWAGWQIPSQKLNAWICPTYHPAYLLRIKDPVLDRTHARHLKEAVQLRDRPWERLPNYESQAVSILDSDEAADRIQRLVASEKPLAFDFETTTLKPDGPHAEIYCCSISDGKVSIAFPWHGKAVRVMREFLRSEVPKIGYNSKFETRWTRAKLGFDIQNWIWDGMLAAHVLDSRPDITGLKFQAFARMGINDYDSHVKPYLKSKDPGGNEPNRIRDLDLGMVLHYCALDSLYEWQIARHQKREMARREN